MSHTCTIKWDNGLGQSYLHAKGEIGTHKFEIRFEFYNFGRIIEDGSYQIDSIMFIGGQDSCSFKRGSVVLIVPIHPINWIKTEVTDYVSFTCNDHVNHIQFSREKSSFPPSVTFDDEVYRYLYLGLEKIEDLKK